VLQSRDMENYTLHRIPLKQVNAYLLELQGKLFLIDSGLKGSEGSTAAACRRIGFSAADIAMILLTHTHYDHAGAAAALRAESGAKLLVHRVEAEVLRSGYSPFPAGANGIGKVATGIFQRLLKGGAAFPSVEPDIEIDRPTDLHRYGFPGRAVPVPSHSAGSLAFLTDEGDCVCGDVLFNVFPGSVFPPFADEPAALPAIWRQLLDLGARQFYPGHGRPFGYEKVEREMARRDPVSR
jgi:hydroxyacylglutathione hydrolase